MRSEPDPRGLIIPKSQDMLYTVAGAPWLRRIGFRVWFMCSFCSTMSKLSQRRRLEGLEVKIFIQPSRPQCHTEQWAVWLIVPLEYAAADGDDDVWSKRS